MSAWNPQANVIFLNALEIAAPAERSAYIQQACREDAELLSHVQSLIAASQKSGSFLENSPLADVDHTLVQPLREAVGTQIGPYKLLQQIGEGGMGVVYMAEQLEPISRRVALKIIKPGMDTKQVIVRFEAERQALAMMDHVNIARVLDAGTTAQGRPYFVMELVNGVSITKYCDDNHLTPRQRLELFVPVCHAIQHAHQKGIIHRDIKPSNVMVTLYDGKPVPKVIDFGVAKATEQKLTERTLFTQYGTMVGTLEYMSPEQAELSALGVDTRSDIYSLGVLLYELLTGSTPLSSKRMKEAAYAEILRLIKEEEPPKPSTRLSESGEALASISAQRHTEPAKLSKLMRGELDWIVMKTLEKDRSRRYETANGFAADVQRYLDDEAVQACPPSAWYRFRKFARRNLRVLATAAVLALSLLVVAGTLGWAVRDREANAREASREREARQTAVEQEVNLAMKETGQLQGQKRWPEALSAARRAEGLLADVHSDELREQVRQLRKDLEMVLRLEDIPLLYSEIRDQKFLHGDADRAYEEAFAAYGIDVVGLPTAECAGLLRGRAGIVTPLAVALDHWALVRGKLDRNGTALTALAEAIDPDPWRRQVRQAVRHTDTAATAVLAVSPEVPRQPPTTFLVLARALRSPGQEAAQLELLRTAQRQHPDDFWINYELAETLRVKGPAFREETVSFLRAALAVRPRNLAVLNSLGLRLNSQGKPDDAIAALRRAIELDPTFDKAHTNLGNNLREQNKLDEAVTCFRKALELNPKSAYAYTGIGNVWFDRKQFDEAIACFRKAVELDPKFAMAHNNLGLSIRFGQEKWDEAIVCFRKALELDPKLGRAHNNLIEVLLKAGRLDEAVVACRGAIKVGAFEDSKERGRLSVLLNNTAWRLAMHPDPKLRDPARAVELAKEAVRLMPDAHWNTLGAAHYRAGDHQAAVAALEQSMKVRNGGDSFDWFFLAMAHRRLGHGDDAREWYDKAVTWMDKNQPTNEELRRFQAEAAEVLAVAIEVASPPRQKK